MLDAALDVFRLKQYFDAVTVARQVARGLVTDAGFVRTVARSVLPPVGPRHVVETVFGATAPTAVPRAPTARVGIAATGGSGALASVVGVARAFEDVGTSPAVISVCSGSALFGFPVAAGVPAEDVARFTAALAPHDYLDNEWARLTRLAPTLGRGFAGLLRGDRLEATLTRWLGGRRLGELTIPCYAPIWNIEANRMDFLGPTTHPDVTVARAIRMAVALPLFFQPVELDGGTWCDGGIVDIFPVAPLLDLEPPPDAVVAVNGFYPPGFVGEDATGWQAHAASILHVAGQVRTCQQVQLAREHLSRLRARCAVEMIEPVSYERVRGVGFYREFLDPAHWPDYMRAGRASALAALDRIDALTRSSPARSVGAAGTNGPTRGRPT